MGASGLGSLLVKEGLLSEQDRQTIARTCGQRSWAFAKSILATGMLDEDELAAFFAENTKFEVAPRGFIQHIDRDLLDKLDGRMVARLEVLPIQVDWEFIHVAVVDPLDKSTISQLEFFTGLKVIPVIAPISEIYRGIQKLVPDFKPHFNALSSFMDNHASNAWQKQRLDGRFANSSEITNEFQKIQNAVNQAAGKPKRSQQDQIDGKNLYQQAPRLTKSNEDIDNSIRAIIDEDIDLDIIEEHDDSAGLMDDMADHTTIDETEDFTSDRVSASFDIEEDAQSDSAALHMDTSADDSDEDAALLTVTEDDTDDNQDMEDANSDDDDALSEPLESTTADDDFDFEQDSSSIENTGHKLAHDGPIHAMDTVENQDKSKIGLDDEDDQIDLVNFEKYTSSPTKNAAHVEASKASKPKNQLPNSGDQQAISQLSGIINQALVKLSLASNKDSAIDAIVTGLTKVAPKGSVVFTQNNENFDILGNWHEGKSSNFAAVDDNEKSAILEFCKSTDATGRGSLEPNALGYTAYHCFNGEQESTIKLFVTMPNKILANENISPMVDDLLGRLERVLSQHSDSNKAG